MKSDLISVFADISYEIFVICGEIIKASSLHRIDKYPQYAQKQIFGSKLR